MRLLEVKGLSKRYKTREKSVFSKFEFSMEKGEFIALMGPSGSGKTTLLNLLSGLEKSDGGQILMEGDDLTKFNMVERVDYRRRKIGMVFQDYHLLESLDVHDNIILPISLVEKDEEVIEQRFKELTDIAQIQNLRQCRVEELSGGEKQRVAICRALINDPLLILADEPTGNLDRRTSRNIMEYFRKICGKTSILMVTHDPYAASFSDRVLFMEDEIIREELKKKSSRQEFFEQILGVMAKEEI